MHSTRDKEKKWKTECGVPLELAHGSNNAKVLRSYYEMALIVK